MKPSRIHSRNVRGRYYVDADTCVCSEACVLAAPENFKIDINGSYVFKQPGSQQEETNCLEAINCCPVEAISNDGDRWLDRFAEGDLEDEVKNLPLDIESKPLKETTFEEALFNFREVLNYHGEVQQLVWVFRDDLMTKRGIHVPSKVWIKLPVPAQNAERAKKSFERARKHGFGVALTAFACCEDGLCCYVQEPIDAEEAEHYLMSPNWVKYSVVTDLPTIMPVRSVSKWKVFELLKFRYRHGNYLNDLRWRTYGASSDKLPQQSQND
jgi:ferredoxin